MQVISPLEVEVLQLESWTRGPNNMYEYLNCVCLMFDLHNNISTGSVHVNRRN